MRHLISFSAFAMTAALLVSPALAKIVENPDNTPAVADKPASVTETSKAPTPSAETSSNSATEADYNTLLKEFIARNMSSFSGNDALVGAYAQRFMCNDWQKARGNEFDMPPLLDKARAEIKTLPSHMPAQYTVLTGASFGSYDSHAGKFPFRIMDPDAEGISFKLSGVPFGASAWNGMLTCIPGNVTGWPEQAELSITNGAAIDGIKLSTDDAKAFLANFPNRQVNLKLTLAADEFKTVGLLKDGLNVNSHIVKAEIVDGHGKVLHTIDEAALKANTDAQAAAKSAAAAAAAVAPIPLTGDQNTWNVVNAWIDHLKGAGADTLPDGTKLRELALGLSRNFDTKISEEGLSLALISDVNAKMPEEGWQIASKNEGLIVTATNMADFNQPLKLTPEQLASIRQKNPQEPCYVSCRYQAEFILQPTNFKEIAVKGSPMLSIPDTTKRVLQTKIVMLVITPTEYNGTPTGDPVIIIKAP